MAAFLLLVNSGIVKTKKKKPLHKYDKFIGNYFPEKGYKNDETLNLTQGTTKSGFQRVKNMAQL